MAKDREKHPEDEEHFEGDAIDEAADEAAEGEEEEPELPDRPTCPQCGWHNTRPSYTKSMLDTALRMFSLRAYRCRSCGNRFRVFRRANP